MRHYVRYTYALQCLEFPLCNRQCVFCEFSPRQCFSLGLSHPSKMDCVAQTELYAIDGLPIMDRVVENIQYDWIKNVNCGIEHRQT